MNSSTHENYQRVVKFVQELLLDPDRRDSVTPALISEKIDLVLKMSPSWGQDLDRDAVTDDLIRRFSLWIGRDTILESTDGHQTWLTASRKTDWRYWLRYREWLERTLSWMAIDALDRSSDRVLGLLEDPLRLGPWDRRGLVVGNVQSGKTGNYTGLICKAADAGYKIVIVLAGLHNNLRSQTQIRLEEGFLGYETSSQNEVTVVTGVGEMDGDRNLAPNCATNRTENGDFSRRIARHLAISPEQRPWLFVVKKNKSVLRGLLAWVQNHVADTSISDSAAGDVTADGLPGVRKRVTTLPLLIIDDEADHASVDTGAQSFDADGIPDDEHRPTTINKLIRRLLLSFSRSAYVGYTATPFANIFIHERGKTLEEGSDLFPEAFIINLAAPSNYVGPASLFGLRSPEGREGGLSLVRHVTDHASPDGLTGWMPPRHRNGHCPVYDGSESPPPSLVEAIDAFLLACAARQIRGQGRMHSSMLIHVTRFNSVQTAVSQQVEEHIRQLRQRLGRRIDHEQVRNRLQRLWESDYRPTTAALRTSGLDQAPASDPSWDEVLSAVSDVISDIQVKIINGTAGDALAYRDHDSVGLKVIAIGGDKLSRGLTLDGLCVSYFLRASRMYDTLMQMGRWFGYRPGYLDLCRLYTTSELTEWFGHITDAAEELREEFDLMVAGGGTPREYGLKVQSHPVLMVTSRLKMRSAKSLQLSFSGRLLETVALYSDDRTLRTNLEAVQQLIAVAGNPEVDPVRTRENQPHTWSGFLWRQVPAIRVIEFFQSSKLPVTAFSSSRK